MLTLQQLLESDSLATIVAKLNQNFQSLSLSNGGPQGILGKQGIPGLPGRVGPMGVTGPEGPTGTIAGIIPFSAIPGTGTTAGPDPTITTVSAYGTVGPWPQSSWQWLKEYYSNGVTMYGVPHVGGTTPKGGDIFIDHANKGYWKFLNQPDLAGAHDETAIPPYSEGGAYSSTGVGSTYPSLGQNLGWVGPGWYYYPPGDTTAESLNNVWIHDTSTYLLSNLQSGVTGPYRVGPIPSNNQSLSIPNARLISKYGTVWITSGNEALTDSDDENPETSTIGEWGYGSGLTYSQPARNNSGIDRLLFKMSLDGLSFLSNVTARGLLPGETVIVAPDVTYPSNSNGDQMNGKNFWVSPYNSVSLDKFSPLLFLSQRNDNVQGSDGTYGSLGIYMYTDTLTKDETVPNIQTGLYGPGTAVRNNNISKSIHLFSSRYSIDPISMFPGGGRTPIKSNSTRNFGEMVLDFRRIVASNQYVCSLPTDLKLSSDFLVTSDINGNPVSNLYYDEGAKDINGNFRNSFRFKTNQGYISSINGKAITGETNTADYWEYGLGTDAPGSTGYATGTHDSTSGTSGMRTRRAWYGSSVLKEKPSSWTGSSVDSTDYIRVAGMMERGRRAKWDPQSEDNYNKTAFLSELIFYTSAFSVDKVNLVNGVGVTNDIVNPSSNAHKSLPSLYVSPYTNIGIGTFVGGYLANNDQGPQEPAAKLHVHLKETTGLADPSKTFVSLANGTGVYANLPIKTYAVAAFSGAVNPSIKKGNIDILLGALASSANELASGNETPINNTVGVGNQLRNAIRSESWAGTNYYTENLSTLRLGAQPFAAGNAIGRSSVSAFRNEFQISLHPLNVRSTDLTNSLTSISGVGIHNMYPRARVHFFGNNTYNETEYGVQAWRPGYMSASAGATFPYYGASSVNSASANQVVIDYIGDSYKYPVGLYEYQYYVFGLFDDAPTSQANFSANAAVYPNKDSLSPTRFAVPYGSNQFYNQSYPSTLPTVAFNNSYKHGGTENAWWEPSSFIGFNLYRDLSSADGNILGDNKDTTKWILGTQGTDGRNHGNNGGAGIISSNTGELGIITIPRGRDGGRAYEEWEQRGLGTRDVLNHMKIIFDKNGNIAIGNAAGWDLDAYPSTNMNIGTGYVNYLSSIDTGLGINAKNNGPLSALSNLSTRTKFGKVSYFAFSNSLYPELPSESAAALINKRATVPEYIRLEVGAEKAWSRDGRMAQKLGFGYPANATIVIPDTLIAKYVRNSYLIPPSANLTTWTLTTDAEGRIINNTFQFRIPNTNPSTAPTPTASNFIVVFPHPTEFNTGGPLASVSGIPVNFIAQTGAIAAEWWGMSTDSPVINNSVLTTQAVYTGANISGWTISFIPTSDSRGSANVRLNNFVYGEGFGFSGDSQEGIGLPRPQIETEYTKNLVKQKRQESPKLIFTFLEKTPNAFEAAERTNSGTDPYLKVSTIISSAQNESAMREYWIPKADNTGGTFMVFTDHFGKKEKDTGFDDESIAITTKSQFDSTRVGLHLEEVVTQEFLAGYTTGRSGPLVTDITMDTVQEGSFLLQVQDSDPYRPANMFPGYVRYYNRSYNVPGQPEVFASNVYGQLVDFAPAVSTAGSQGSEIVATGVVPKTPPRSTYRIAPLGGESPSVTVNFTMASNTFSVRGVATSAENCCSGCFNPHSKYLDAAYSFSYDVMKTGTYSSPTVAATSSSSGNVSNWFDATTGKITVGAAGIYDLEIDFTRAVAPVSGMTLDGSNGCPACCRPDWKNYVAGNSIVVYLYKNNTNTATLSSGSTSLSLSLAAGDTLDIRTTYSLYGNADTDGTTYCDCSDLEKSLFNNYRFSLTSGTFTLRKGTGGGCPQTLTNSIPKLAMARRFNFATDQSCVTLPINDDFVCPTHTMVNVDDNYVATGTGLGSVVSLNGANPKNILFNRNPSILEIYDKVKIKINFSGRTPNTTAFYNNTYRDLVFRFLPSGTGSGSNGVPPGDFSKGVFLNGGNLYVQSPSSVSYAIFPGKPTVGDAYLYEGYAELYISKATWESADAWALCAGLWEKDPQPVNEVMSSDNFSLANEFNRDSWEIDKLSIEFEVISSELTNSANNYAYVDVDSTASSVPLRASIRRNVDKFYSIYSPTTNYDDGWGTQGNNINAPVINNKASSIRMKRINSEFALVDFNITIEVDNPWLDIGLEDPKAATSLVDFGSPRFTQYLRFTYVPDEAFWQQAEYDQDFAHDLFGNGMWFSNWSSYKNWLPGTGIVGDDILNGQYGELGSMDNYNGGEVGSARRNISSDWSPTFNDSTLQSRTDRPILRTWNGNLLEMLSFKSANYWQEMAFLRESPNYGILKDPLNGTDGNGWTNVSEGQGIFSAFGNDGAMLRIAQRVFNYSNRTEPAGTTEWPQKQKAFMGFLGAMHAMWGNQAFERNSNTQWRMSPAYNYIDESTGSSTNLTNNGFTLEVQFSKPMLHVDTPLGAGAFGVPATSESTVQPYKFLTVSGQGIVRYAQTIKS